MKISKKIKVLLSVIIMLIIMGVNNLPSFAAVCNLSPDGVHHFCDHRRLGVGYTEPGGYHEYLYGYDEKNKPIYNNDCWQTIVYEYCVNCCKYCRIVGPDDKHPEYATTNHSVLHSLK